MTCGPAHANLVLAHGDFRPARADLRPARADLHPAHAENQPEVTLGAHFHGYFHVLKRVQKVCPSLDKVPKRAKMSESAVLHKNTMVLLAKPNKTDKNTLPRAQ